MKKIKREIKKLILIGLLIYSGLIIFKYLPEIIYGEEIRFDASAHLVWIIFILYFFYVFIGFIFYEKKKFRKNFDSFYFLFSFLILILVGINRIKSGAHNEIGLFLGLLIGAFSVIIVNWKEIRERVEF